MPRRGRSQPQAKATPESKARDRILGISTGTRSAQKQKAAKREAGVPDVYQDLLSEATDSSLHEIEVDRPLKRRRVAYRRDQAEGSNAVAQAGNHSDTESELGKDGNGTRKQPQVITDSENESYSDLEWEQIVVGTASAEDRDRESASEILDVNVEIGGPTTPTRKVAARRKPPSAAEKLLRLATHKAHLLFLLFHAHQRNGWCNNKTIEARLFSRLRTILSSRIIGFLNPDPDHNQLRRSDSFLDGLRLAVDVWRAKYQVTASGMVKPQWAENDADIAAQIRKISDELPPFDKADFLRSASTLKGSQDTGNQLFCALLRAVGVEARLVCSLQPLPLATNAKSSTPQKPKTTIYADADSEQAGTTSAEDMSAKGSASETTPGRNEPRPRRRIGQPSLGMPVGNYQQAPTPVKKRAVRKLQYPVFWVEAFNAAYQKWTAVDATVLGMVSSKPSRFEPPASYDLNTTSYVVAFEEDGSAKDVTKRYTRAYNAKTRRNRVEATEGGNKWWRKALETFRRSHGLDRDQVEDAELAQKELAEGMPNSIQDFKDHPYYVLERHLKRHEIIWPKREIAKTSAGKNAGVESVYRRSDVQHVRSADKWYRFGREIKPGEQPVKHVPARSRRGKDLSMDDMEDDDGDPTTTPLYAYFQTELYVPPPVVRGRVPRNQYGNLDVYVPSMIPPGASHIRHAQAAKAARLISIDFADAVTGFQFKGRHGTAVVSGVIVAQEYKEAVEAIIAGFEHEHENRLAEEQSRECLRLWRRFYTGLKIAERIGLRPGVSVTDTEAANVKQVMDDAEDEREETMEAGGFFPDAGSDNVAQPTAGHFPQGHYDDDEQGDFLNEEMPTRQRRKRVLVESDDDSDVSEYGKKDPSSKRSTKARRSIRYHDEGTPDESYDTAEAQSMNNQYVRGRQAPVSTHQDQVAPLPGNTDGRDMGIEDAEDRGTYPTQDTHDRAEDEHENGGGFFPEDIPEDLAPKDDLGGGFVQEDENESDARMDINTIVHHDQELGLNTGGRFPAEEYLGARDDKVNNDEVQASADVQALNEQKVVLPSPDEEEEEEPEKSVDSDGDAQAEEVEYVSDVEAGSLPSHDPEDEDAEPDWLEDV